MIQQTITDIENRIRNTVSVDEVRKNELLALVANLKREIAALAATHDEQAQSIAGLAQLSTAEITKKDKNPERVQSSINDLAASVGEFEKSHPTLVEVVNRICTTLSNLGI
jgi:hypothetical protein